jgi:hypothetical protein
MGAILAFLGIKLFSTMQPISALGAFLSGLRIWFSILLSIPSR